MRCIMTSSSVHDTFEDDQRDDGRPEHGRRRQTGRSARSTVVGVDGFGQHGDGAERLLARRYNLSGGQLEVARPVVAQLQRERVPDVGPAFHPVDRRTCEIRPAFPPRPVVVGSGRSVGARIRRTAKLDGPSRQPGGAERR